MPPLQTPPCESLGAGELQRGGRSAPEPARVDAAALQTLPCESFGAGELRRGGGDTGRGGSQAEEAWEAARVSSPTVLRTILEMCNGRAQSSVTHSAIEKALAPDIITTSGELEQSLHYLIEARVVEWQQRGTHRLYRPSQA